MTVIACLHTAESNVAVFDAALHGSGTGEVTLQHHVRADLLAAAEAAGGLTPDIAARTVEVLQALCGMADAVLLTCSTLGPAADTAARTASVPILRVDAALAHEATRHGGRVVVLCAVETAVEPTRYLFEAAARGSGAKVEVHLVPGDWAAFRAGDDEGHLALVVRAADKAWQAGATRVALAQASMAGAAARVTGPPPLTSPGAGLAAIRAQLS